MADDRKNELEATLKKQRDAFTAARPEPVSVRKDRIKRAMAMVTDRGDELARAMAADFGNRSVHQSMLTDIAATVGAGKHALKHIDSWSKTEKRKVQFPLGLLGAKAEVRYEPKGVIGILSPWNFPVQLAFGPLMQVLAAGNRAMIKPSEFTERTSAIMAEVVAKYFAEEEVALYTGGPEVAAAFSSLPFDHLVFTGSTEVGRKVMAAASENLTPVTLELGGKSPTVVAPGYPIARAAKRILAGKLLNAGQTCIAPDYVLVPRAGLQTFVEHAARQARRMYPRGLADTDFTSVINARQYTRLTRYLEEAQAAGVKSVPLFDGPPRDAAARRLGPVVLVDPPATLAVMREEIFGPILPVLPYDDVADAVQFINAQPRPLALYWFDNDGKRTDWALRETHVGGACVNETLLHVAQEELPFGGVGPSGMGHYHGRWGFDTLSKLTPVFRQSRLNGMEVFMPPYRPVVHRLLALMKRW